MQRYTIWKKQGACFFFEIDVLHLDLHMQSLQSDFSTAIYVCTLKKKIKVNTIFVFAVTIKFYIDESAFVHSTNLPEDGAPD